MSRSPEQLYHQRCEALAAERDLLARQSLRAANRNVVLFVVALALLAFALWRGYPPALALSALAGLGFVASFVQQGRIDRRHARAEALYAINAEGLARIRRDFAALPLRQPLPVPPDHPYAFDLDLCGPSSLLHLLGLPSSPAGQERLQRWLLEPAPPAAARLRQGAALELAPQPELREELALRGRQVAAHQRGYAQFRRWAEQGPWLRGRPALLWAARLLPPLTLALLAAQLLGAITLPLALIPFAITTLISYTLARGADAEIEQVAARQETFRAYAELFALVEAQPWRDEALRAEQARLAASGLRADAQIRRLGRLMPLADLRGWMFFVPIQLLTLWNVHLLWLLERWRDAAGASVGAWLDALGEIEALAALATLRHDQPAWAMPQLDAAAARLEASDLGHPLLSESVRVGNDIALGPAGRLLLLSGSNMSGKSTLLRAIGLNVVLAQAGAPVCAAALRLPPLQLATSMRVQDSLAQGVSYFLAELKRLKLVVDQARAAQEAGQFRLLFLLDEILQGTNTAERQIAARRVMLHLLELEAMGAVSTHDLTLADDPALAAVSEQVHLTEQITRGPQGPLMRFDYKLRPGVATSTNALVLMELVGLPGEG